ncbi:marine proteobacterial sortase target protein [Shewanella sp. UCD-KL12]|uniref:marine proteobacterial sortase target protein n=1 Tax=Shewanella sp. UCD-KL12 TaxID=1917163 RepID=UPI000971159F|nr:marine proteobacterial sortase target protein [Shewanella sp. UCD-KL12]
MNAEFRQNHHSPLWGRVLSFTLLAYMIFSSDQVIANEDTEVTQGSFIYQHIGDDEKHTALALHTDVEMNVSGWLNRVSVKQTFNNDTEHWINGDYVFPLPHDAAVDYMRLKVGDRVIEGQVKTRNEARKSFQAAKDSGNRASLIEQTRANIFTTSVANLAPHETLVVEINYQELVRFEKGEFSLRFPMLVNPRYSPNRQARSGLNEPKSLNQRVTQSTAGRFKDYVASRFSSVDAGPKVNIDISLDAGAELAQISSPYHDIESLPLSSSRYQVQLTSETIANRDFVLKWKPIETGEPLAAIYAQEGQTHSTKLSAEHVESDYGLLMIVPPELGKHNNKVARELILVIDTSGSMSGEAIEQAKKAMVFALAGLGSKDIFNIIEFNSSVNLLADHAINATAANIGRANQFIRGLSANGGTEMALALRQALADTPAEPSLFDDQNLDAINRLKQVLFMTDGAVTNERELFSYIEEHIGGARLFTIGIGSAPNSYFMQRAAEFGRGTFTYIGKLDEVQSKLESLLYKVEHPQVTDIELYYADGTIPDHWPANIPDLYANEPLLVAIKMKPKIFSAVASELVVTGNIGEQYWQRSLSLTDRQQAAGLDLLWARKQIAALDMSKDGVNDSRIKKQITALALNYHLVSQYTSLVAVDMSSQKHPSVVSNSASVIRAIPHGWQTSLGKMPQTGGDSRLLMMIGMILLGLGLAYIASFGLDRATTLGIYRSLLESHRDKSKHLTSNSFNEAINSPSAGYKS